MVENMMWTRLYDRIPDQNDNGSEPTSPFYVGDDVVEAHMHLLDTEETDPDVALDKLRRRLQYKMYVLDVWESKHEKTYRAEKRKMMRRRFKLLCAEYKRVKAENEELRRMMKKFCIFEKKGIRKTKVPKPASTGVRGKKNEGPCTNCGVIETTQWRLGESGEPLCNACGLRYVRACKRAEKEPRCG